MSAELPILTSKPAIVYRQTHVIGGHFSETLRCIEVDARGRIHAAGDSCVMAFDPAGRVLRRLATSRPAHSVAAAADGTVWVGEAGQIEIFETAGKLAGTWRDDVNLGRVTAIGFAGDSVFAGDATDRAIRRFDRKGAFRHDIGKDNPVNGFLIPNGVVDFAVDAEGVIHAANPGKHRVERYSAEGKLLGRIGRFDGIAPEGFPGCCNPTNVAVRKHVYVTEKAGPRAKVYDFSGKLLAVIATDVFDPNCKNMSIDVDARGRVYVGDTVRRAIFVFEPAAPSGVL